MPENIPQSLRELLRQYTEEIRNICGSHVKSIILYGSYARGDFRPDSDIDIMILLDMEDTDLSDLRRALSYMTYDFNLDNDTDIMPYPKSEAHFRKWVDNYPFYSNVSREGIVLYGAA